MNQFDHVKLSFKARGHVNASVHWYYLSILYHLARLYEGGYEFLRIKILSGCYPAIDRLEREVLDKHWRKLVIETGKFLELYPPLAL